MIGEMKEYQGERVKKKEAKVNMSQPKRKKEKKKTNVRIKDSSST